MYFKTKMDKAYSISRNTGVVLFSEGEGWDGSSPFSPLTEVIELSDRNEWWFLVPTGLPIPRRLCPLT